MRRDDMDFIADAMDLHPLTGSWREDADVLGETEAFVEYNSTQKILDKYPPEICPLCGGCCDAVQEDEDLTFVCEDCETEFNSQMQELIGKSLPPVWRLRR